MMMQTKANKTSPGLTQNNAAVLATQATVTAIRSFFLAACRSAHAPMAGMVSITMAYEKLSAMVQAKVAHSALSATAPTK